jgi:uncharacterized membrane protein YobD (UPF0266 family)
MIIRLYSVSTNLFQNHLPTIQEFLKTLLLSSVYIIWFLQEFFIVQPKGNYYPGVTISNSTATIGFNIPEW